MLLGVRKDRVVVEFRMGGVVRLDRSESGEWAVSWAVTPELLPALAAGADGIESERPGLQPECGGAD